MVWFKVDDKLHDHRKARAAGKAAMGVWVLAGSWCGDNLTDGFVPASILPRWGTKGDAKKLCDVGLWHPDEQDGEKGWRFHEWDKLNPTRAKKLAEREARAAAGRVGGLESGRSRRQANGKQVASGVLEPPSRPDPYPLAVVQSVPDPQHDAQPVHDQTDGLDLEKIKTATHGTGRHAFRTAELILDRAPSDVRNPTAYVLAAIRQDPDAYRYHRGNPTRDTACPDHPGEWADACRAHAIDRRIGDTA